MLKQDEIAENADGLLMLHMWTTFVRLKDPEQNKKLHKIVKHVNFHLRDGSVAKCVPYKTHDWSLSRDKGATEISLSRKSFYPFDMKVEIVFADAIGLKPLVHIHLLNYDRPTTKSYTKLFL